MGPGPRFVGRSAIVSTAEACSDFVKEEISTHSLNMVLPSMLLVTNYEHKRLHALDQVEFIVFDVADAADNPVCTCANLNISMCACMHQCAAVDQPLLIRLSANTYPRCLCICKKCSSFILGGPRLWQLLGSAAATMPLSTVALEACTVMFDFDHTDRPAHITYCAHNLSRCLAMRHAGCW